MSEKDPTLNLNLGNGKKMELNHSNTKLYTFLGRTAINDVEFENSSVNHVFVETEKGDGNIIKGMWFFEKFHPVYRNIAEFAIEHSWPQYLNQREIAVGDLTMYQQFAEKEADVFAAKLDAVQPSDFK